MPPSASRTPGLSPASVALPQLDAHVRTLPNGLDVLIREDASHPLVSVQVWVRAGSLHEENWTGAGLAHCVEHMMFKGTSKRNAEAITRDIQASGGYVNAYTTFNRTVYWIDGLAENTGTYLEILADMMQNLKLDPAELAREQDVIRREMAMDLDDPDGTLHHLMQATAFRRHPLRHPIIGHRAVFDQVSHADVAAFVRRHYVPNNCFLVIAGAVKHKPVLKAVDSLFGPWQRRPYEPVILPSEPTLRGIRREHRDFPTDVSRVALGWQTPGEDHPDKPALDVLGFLLGSGRSSRLHQLLREQRAIAHQVWAGGWGAAECGLFQIEADCDPAHMEPCLVGMHEAVATFKQHGPSPDELEKAVRATLSGQLRSMVSTKGQASALAGSWLSSGTTDRSLRYLEAIRNLTPQDLVHAAETYLQPDRHCEVTLGPPGCRPAPRLATARTKKHSALQTHDLGHGLTLLVGENHRLPLVSIRAQFLAGVLAETNANAGVSMASSHLLLKGTQHRDAATLQSTLENLGGSLLCTADAHRRLIGADVMAGDEGTAVDLIADLLLHPTLPAAGLDEIRSRQTASLREEQEDPLTIALRRARAEIFAGSPLARTALGTEPSLASLTTTQCRTALRRTLVRENAVVTVFGAVDGHQIAHHLGTALADLPSGQHPFDPKRLLPTKSKPGRWEQHVDKEQATLVIGFRTVDLHHADTPALNLIDEACSDMGSRLFNRIREELGLAYYVGAQAFSALSGGAFYFYLGTAPEKLDLAEAEMIQLIADLAQNGLEPDELERARTTWRSSWLRAQQGNPALADQTGWNTLNGLGADHFQTLPERMAAITPQAITRTAATYLHPSQAFTVRVTRG